MPPTRPGEGSILDEDGRLSSASAATSLKYAKAEDLPSYPSTGGVKLSAAGAAASLASSNQRAFEHWKPEAIPAANRAALLAKDVKVEAMYTPEASAAGSRAAMMAAANPIQVEAMQPRKPTTNKATPAYDVPADSHRKALMAATAASHSSRRELDSTPNQTSTQPADDSTWALKAATQSHRSQPSPASGAFTTGDPGFEAARIQNLAKNNVDRQMFTAAPPVSIEVEEKNRQDTLRASAIAMAQKMYAIQQKHIDDAAAASKSEGQALAASRARSSTAGSNHGGSDGVSSVGGYENLEDAARKLAQERLAKIHDEHAEYRNYYGQSTNNRNRMSFRSGRRGSATANRDDDDSDQEQSRRIRSQMSIFQSKLADVDSKKRQQDRDALLEIAHRNVEAQISRMDERIFQDTGKASPAQVEKWQKAAREKAQRDSDERMQNTGKVHIGGGKYLDQSELDAIAKARLQPTLDDISDKAEKQRARDEEERLEREKKLEQQREEKAKAAEKAAALKAENDRQKQEAKVAREAEKERARLEKEEKRKSKESKPSRISTLLGRGTGNAATTTTVDVSNSAPRKSADIPDETTVESGHIKGETAKSSTSTNAEVLTFHDAVTHDTPESVPTTVIKKEESPDVIQSTLIPGEKKEEGKADVKPTLNDPSSDPASPNKSRGRSWIQRLRGKSNAQKDDAEVTAVEPKSKAIGSDTPATRADSMHDVAMAGRTETNETSDLYGAGRDVSPERSHPEAAQRSRNSSVSALSNQKSSEFKPNTDFSLGTIEPVAEDKDDTGTRKKLLKKIRPTKEKLTTDEPTTKLTDDEFEEARDKFDDNKLVPPPASSSAAGDNTRALSPKGSRERSRFTEEL